MPNFDALLDAQQPPEAPPMPEQPEFDKEAWAAGKKQQREELYALADTTALSVADDPARFTQYLDVQARFDRYSATNALLVLAQRPNATQLGDLDHWKKQKVFIKSSELGNAVLILAPGKEYEREDGSIGTSVDAKRVYDMSQAERPRIQQQPKFDERTFAALKKAAPLRVQGVDNLGQDAVIKGDTIFVQKGMGPEATICALAREACRAEYLQQGSAPEAADLAACAGAYMICKKYGADTKGIDLSDAQEFLSSFEEARDVRDALSDVRKAATEITGRMAKELEPRKAEARA